VNIDTPLFDGSLAECRQQLMQWRHTRFGIVPSRPFFHKLHRSYEIVCRNKLNFTILLFLYLAAQTLGNASLLMLQWTIDKDHPSAGNLILVQLTAN
jgi:hypothetical protein